MINLSSNSLTILYLGAYAPHPIFGRLKVGRDVSRAEPVAPTIPRGIGLCNRITILSRVVSRLFQVVLFSTSWCLFGGVFTRSLTRTDKYKTSSAQNSTILNATSEQFRGIVAKIFQDLRSCKVPH